MVVRQDKKDGSRARACARSTAITAAALALAVSLGAPALAQPGSGGMMGQYRTQPVQTAPEAARGYPPGAYGQDADSPCRPARSFYNDGPAMMGIAGPGFGYGARMMAGAGPDSGYGPGMMAVYGSGFGYGPGAMAGYAAPYRYGPGMMWGDGFAPGGPARPALTDGQRRQLEQIYRSYFGSQARLHSRLVAGMLDLGEAMAGRNPQPRALDKAYDRLAAVRKALFFNNFNMRAKIDAVLATQPSAAPRANVNQAQTPAKDHN